MSETGGEGGACIANIGPRGIRLRRITGAIGLGLGLVFGIAVVLADVPRALRVLAFAPFFAGSLGIYQAQAKTCVAFASRRIRDPDAEAAPAGLDEAAIDAAIARTANLVRLRALVTAAVLTLLLYLVPATAR